MKTFIFFFMFGIFISLNLCAQPVLRALVSLPRSGDRLLQQQITFCPPGEMGKGIIWDFSDHDFLPYTEQTVYTGNADSILCMNRNKTSYKYRLTGDSLFCLGRENYTSQVTYLTPVAWLHYPFAYGDTISSNFIGIGSYSHALSLTTYGHICVSADAYGTLLLPDGDTLRNVLRIHRSEYIGQHLCSPKDNTELNLLLTCEGVADRLSNDSVSWQVDTYQWYISGYRYPVLESVETCFLRAGHSTKHFSRSVLFSPNDQKYLEDDPDNMAIRDNSDPMYFMSRQIDRNLKKTGKPNKKRTNDICLSCASKSTDGIQAVNYRLDRDANVEIMLVSVSGMVIYHEPEHPAKPGNYAVDIDISQWRDINLVLSVIVDGEKTTLKILK